jgi:phosphatidylglycerophosphatase A
MQNSLPLLTVFGLGHLRPASGTWGSLPPPLIAAGLVFLHLDPAHQQTGSWIFRGVMIALVIGFSWSCIALGDAGEARWGKDPSRIVADETAGQALTLLFLPAWCFQDRGRALLYLLIAFVAFRVCDVLKPWPANSLQRVRGGWGVLLDDLVAGAYAGLLTLAFAKIAAR